ncbi:MAG: GAF domain-containing protein [Anaerolineae bacterium]
MRFLLIGANSDDCASIIRELHQTFSHLQIEQITEASGFEQALERGDFHLAIADDHLGWSSGQVILRTINDRYPNKPVILLVDANQAATSAGAAHYLAKSPKQLARLPGMVQSILEQTQQYQWLADAEARYRRLFESVPVGLYRAAPDGQILNVNRALVQMMGYPDRESLLAVNISNLYVDPEDRLRWQALMEQEGRVHNFETRQCRHDGQIIWVQESAQAARDERGRVLYYEGQLEDITERKRAEAAEREQHELAEARAAELRAREQYLVVLNDITQAALETPDLKTTLQTLADRLGDVFEADGCLITLWDEARQATIPTAAFGPLREIYPTMRPKSGEATVTGAVLRAEQALVVEDVFNSPYFNPEINAVFRMHSILGLPLIAGESKLGAALIVFSRYHHFSPTEVKRGEQVAKQIALAIAKAQLLETEHEQRLLAETLREVTLAIASQMDRNAVLDEILHQAHRLVPFNTASIMLLEGDILRSARWHGYEDVGSEVFISNLVQRLSDLPLDTEIVRSRKPMIVSDTHQEPDWVAFEETAWIRSFLTVPICLGERVLGLLRLDGQTPGRFSARDAERLHPLANAAAIALENARLFEAEREQRLLAEALREVEVALSSTLDFETLLDHLLEQIARVVSCDAASILLIDEGQARIARMVGYEQFGPEAVEAMASLSFDIATTATLRQMYTTKQPLVIPNVAAFPEWVNVETGVSIGSWAGAPIIIHDQVIGFFSVDKIKPDSYGTGDTERLAAFAGQTAVLLENARLFETVTQRAAELEAIRQASLSLTSSLELEVVLEAIMKSMLRLLAGVDNVSIFLYQGDCLTSGVGLWADGHRGSPVSDPRPEGLHYTVAQQGAPIVVSDMHTHPLFSDIPPQKMGAIVGLPLKIGRRTVGVVSVFDPQPRDWRESELRVLRLLADQAAIAIENARLFEESQRRSQELSSLYDIALATGSILETETLLTRLYDPIQKLMALDIFGVFHYHPESEEYEIVLAIEAEQVVTDAVGMRVPLEDGGLTGWVMRTRQSLLIDDLHTTKLPIEPRHLTQPARAWLGVPLLAHERLIGAISVQSFQPYAFGEDDRRFLESLAAQAAIAIQNARLYAQVQRHAAELEERVNDRTYTLQVLYELSQQIGYSMSYDELFRLVLTHLLHVVPYEVAGVCLLTAEKCDLYLQPTGPLASTVQSDIEARVLTTMAGLSERPLHPEQLTIINLSGPETFGGDQPPLEALGAFFQVSLLLNGKILGLLFVSTKTEEQFTGDRIRFTYTVANQASQAIQRLRNLVAAEQQRLENLVAHLPEGVLLLNQEGRLLVSNPAGRQALTALNPISEGEVLTNLGDYSLETILARHADPLPLEIELDGFPQRVFEIKARPINTPEKQWVLALREVTQERQNELKLQMQERLATVGQLAAGIAHDFNNILTSIIGFAELVRLDPNLGPTSSHDLERIVQQGQRAAQLVRQILDFSRQSIAEKRHIDLVIFLKETFKLLERTIPENIHLSLEIDPDCRDCLVNADPTQMQQVLTNLALNAQDAMPTGGRLHFHLVEYTPSASKTNPCPEMVSGRWLALSIQDNGTGIPPKILPHIFEPFFTTKEVGKGTGLGLAQVYGIVKQHGGCIDVTSREGQGSTFTLYLPAAPAPQKAKSKTPQTELRRGNGELLLVVEDETEVLEVIQAMLTQLGYQVVTASNGQEALTVYNRQGDNIALVLTDITMPEMGGLVLAQMLQNQDPTLKVVAMTGYPREAKDFGLLAQGVVDWLPKPVNIEQLAQTMSRLLGE